VATSDSCDAGSPAADSDSTETEEDSNFSSANYVFMTGFFYEGSNIKLAKLCCLSCSFALIII